MPLSWNEIRQNAIAFSHEWAEASRERAEAQTFWNEFFDVFGVRRRTVASFEEPVRNLAGNFEFIDLLWPGTLIAEHKSRGGNLSKAESQAMAYVRGLIDDERREEVPQYILVSDFGRLALHDLESDETSEFPLSELHEHIHTFAFIAGYRTQVVDPEDPANIEAAELLAQLYDTLKAGGYPEHNVERFMVRLLFCMFAEDTGLFGQPDAFRLYIENNTRADGSDLGIHLGRYFEILDTAPEDRQQNLDEQLAELPHVNGELFAERLPFAEFNRDMRNRLLACCSFRWTKISPAVFGSLFQSIMEAPERRQIGGHYTSERDIMKLIKSLFLDDLRAEFERAKITSRPALQRFHEKLGSLKFLDPACGCGNFLVIAYRELRELELELLKELHRTELAQGQQVLEVRNELRLNVDQMHGIEILEWPARIAEVALWLMDHQMNLEVSEAFGQYVARLPLKDSPHIVCANALRMDWKDMLPTDECDYVLGNPPFVGKKARTEEQVEDMRRVFGTLTGTGTLDYVSCWYRRAADYTRDSAIRVAFVSTNSITQGEQAGILWPHLYRQYNIKIHFGHRSFPWESEAQGRAHVHVVIVGFGEQNLQEKQITDYDAKGTASGTFTVSNISPYLAEGSDRAVTNISNPLSEVPRMSFGNMPNDGGFLILDDEERDTAIASDPRVKPFIRLLISAHHYLHGENRWCLWLEHTPPSDIQTIPFIRDRVAAVRAYRARSRRATTRDLANYPALFGEIRQPTDEYVLVPCHSSEKRDYIPLSFCDPLDILNNSCLALPHATLYHFGILHSAMHMAWVRQICGRLESRYRYSAKVVYNNFPWPDSLTDARRAAVGAAAQGVLDAREQFPNATLADLYDPLSMPAPLRRAHNTLDRTVDRCYRPQPFPDERRRFEYLFETYERMTAPLTAGRRKKRRSRRQR